MEVAIVDKDCIKIKGKNVSFLIDPSASIPKTQADAVIFLSDFKDSNERAVKADEYRVIVKGEGSYEVGGARIIGFRSGDNFFYSLYIDGLTILLASASGIEKQLEKGEYNMVVLNVNTEFKGAMVSSFEPSVAIVYGEKASEAVKLIGKEHVTASKTTHLADKLPPDTQIILLK